MKPSKVRSPCASPQQLVARLPPNLSLDGRSAQKGRVCDAGFTCRGLPRATAIATAVYAPCSVASLADCCNRPSHHAASFSTKSRQRDAVTALHTSMYDVRATCRCHSPEPSEMTAQSACGRHADITLPVTRLWSRPHLRARRAWRNQSVVVAAA